VVQLKLDAGKTTDHRELEERLEQRDAWYRNLYGRRGWFQPKDVQWVSDPKHKKLTGRACEATTRQLNHANEY
jgi:hypothetical protein